MQQASCRYAYIMVSLSGNFCQIYNTDVKSQQSAFSEMVMNFILEAGKQDTEA